MRIALAATRHGRADTQRGVDLGHSPLLSRVAGAYRPHRQVSRRFRAVSHRFREWVREGIAQVSRGVADIHRFAFFERFREVWQVSRGSYRGVSQGIARYRRSYFTVRTGCYMRLLSENEEARSRPDCCGSMTRRVWCPDTRPLGR